MNNELVGKHKYVRVSNLDRVSGTANNFTSDLSNDIDMHLVRGIWLDSVSLTHTFNNIDQYNNVLEYDYQVLGEVFSGIITVPEGQYNVNELMAVLKVLIEAELVGTTIDFTLDPITNKITYVAVGGIEGIKFVSISTTPTSTLSPHLGITLDTSLALTDTFNSIPSLEGKKMVFLHSKELNLSNTIISKNRNVSTFASIPINVPYLSIINYSATGTPTDKVGLQGIKDISNINIKVRDAEGRLMNIDDNNEVIVVFKCVHD